MGTTVRKVSISLTPDSHAWAMDKAKREHKSLSAVIDAALQMEQQNEAALRVVERIGVQASPEEVEALLHEWNAPAPRAPRLKATPKKASASRSWRRRSA